MIANDRSARAILSFWFPLALQWMMMATEGPFLAAVIARLADPTFNLAAYGVAFAFAILVESPVIMLMSASTALVEDGPTFRRMRRFTWALNGLSTLLLIAFVVPPVHRLVTGTLLGLPPDVASLVHGSLWILLPWPAAIGYRRFLHGLLIRAGRTRLVALGTVLRLAGMATTALLLAPSGLPGAWVGAAALSGGVLVEAAAARFMAAATLRELTAGQPVGGAGPAAGSLPTGTVLRRPEAGGRVVVRGEMPESGAAAIPAGRGNGPRGPDRGAGRTTARAVEVGPSLSYGSIARFYYPLALTSLIGLAAQPLLTFFMGRSPAPIESLALFPVVHALNFFFSAFGLSYQEAAIALLGRDCEHAGEVGRFAVGLGVVASGGLALIAFTPLADFWFGTVSGLTESLAELAILPTRILIALPALGVAIAYQRAILVQRRTTRPITAATVIEILGIAVIFPIFGWVLGVMGVVAAMIAMVVGRAAGVGYLVPRTTRALRRIG